MYADNLVCLAPDEHKLQKLLDIASSWCYKWLMQINAKKTQIMHIRNYQRTRSKHNFTCCGKPLTYAENYKYLGYILNEHLSDKPMVNAVTGAASRSFGRVVNLFKALKNLCHRSYETLYESYVNPILSYASAIWGFAEHNDPQILQNRIQRYFLGVHTFAPVSATHLEFNWPETKYKRWTEMG